MLRCFARLQFATAMCTSLHGELQSCGGQRPPYPLEYQCSPNAITWAMLFLTGILYTGKVKNIRLASTTETKTEDNPWWPVILFICLIVIFFSYIFSRRREAADLKTQLKAQKAAFEELAKDIEGAKKLRQKVAKRIRVVKIVLRISFLFAMTILNVWFVLEYYPSGRTLREGIEGVVTLTTGLTIGLSAILFLRYGNFMDLKTAYRSFQIYIVCLLFKKKQSQIEALLRMRELSHSSLAEEIEKTDKAIQEIETELSQIFKTAPMPSMPGMPLPAPPITDQSKEVKPPTETT